MKNLKDTATSICAYLIGLIAALQLMKTQGLAFPHWVDSTCIVVGGIAVFTSFFLQGKNPDGSIKSIEQVETQNQQSKSTEQLNNSISKLFK